MLARALFGKADLTMLLNGALAGVVSITATPKRRPRLLVSAIGAIGGLLVVLSIIALDKLRIDEPVGAISVHGAAGVWGVLAVLLSNEDATLGGQLMELVCIFGIVFGTSLITWLVVKVAMGIRPSADDEMEGCDLSEYGIPAYPEFVTGAVS